MQSNDHNHEPSPQPPLNYKVVVVGGGVTGLYCALRLPAGSVALFEGSDRWGGRVETVLMGKPGGPRFKAEFGPMRFESVGQKKLMNLLHSLKIQTSPFPAYQSPPVNYPEYDLTDPDERRLQTPMALLLMGILKALGRYSPGMAYDDMREVVETYGEDSYPGLRRTARQGGTGELLHKRGLWNVLSDVLSHQAVLKIRDTGNFYHMIHENPNAIEWIIFWLRAFQPNDRLVGIQHGSASLTKGLVDALTAQMKPLYTEHWLSSIEAKGNKVNLEFRHGDKPVKVLADHVVLALPRRPLEHLAPMLPAEVRGDIDTVRGIPLLKCFFVVTKPWWDEDTKPHTNAGHMPAREVHYYQEHTLQLDRSLHLPDLRDGRVTAALRSEFKNAGVNLPEAVQLVTRARGWRLTSESHDFFIAREDCSVFNRKGKGMVMVYTDRPATEFWNEFVVDRTRHDRAELRGSQELKTRFFKFLSRQLLADVARQPECLRCFEGLKDEAAIERAMLLQVEDWGIHDWEHEPYGGAFHVWRPGVASWTVMDRLKAFGEGKRLHIVGEAYSDYQGFIEGCLNSAELALETIPREAEDG